MEIKVRFAGSLMPLTDSSTPIRETSTPIAELCPFSYFTLVYTRALSFTSSVPMVATL